MATIVNSIGLKGIEGYLVQVEIQMVDGIQAISIIGLPDASVKESKDRVLGTLGTYQCVLPEKRVIVNLSPAEQRKNSPIFDLAMAIGMMKEMDYFSHDIPETAAFLGVLSLNGSVKPVDGMLPAILAARNEGIKVLYLPIDTDLPFRQLEGIELRFVKNVEEVIQSFSGQAELFSSERILPPIVSSEQPYLFDKDFKHIIGHQYAKGMLEIAAAGGHNVLMYGPPGCGKSFLAETFPSILPPLTEKARYEVMSLYQLAKVKNASYIKPPFRSPHHSSSAVSLIGGGTNPIPGEISLANHGVLFLDEFAEFPKRTLDMLRQPLETGKVTISRAASTVTYPAQFILIAAMNPCPCGHLGSKHAYCTCTSKQITTYQNRVSGPILDRFDLMLHLQSISLTTEPQRTNESSEEIRKRVMEARERQYDRYGEKSVNGTVSTELFLEKNKLSQNQRVMVQQWSSKENYSNRVQIKLMRLARTISDLQGEKELTNESLWKAVTMRRKNQLKSQKEGVK
ncbi:YifB family Mg chelatase-like AAA ATPase [Heyndrickxia coagulans]|uniref:MCM C-terminal AAA(+) ATPase domain-containing protein n=1 Tax=Heyndrickxia coagulans TaxID=1398 RepID=A0A150K4W9_HEYCO|nr:YifB family Mg chelatase-like AAA ATPase [Heyndrickxia coagulans]KYC64502.1 hypothetical protein B4099_1018 [Heyndrickxia coagulans]